MSELIPSQPMLPDEWSEIVSVVKASQLADWHAYECVNDVQSLTRLSRVIGRHEVQLNWILHSEKPHSHGCDMTSLILMHGYGYWLKQYGCDVARYQFAAPGSLVTMGPQDGHWIPAQRERSLSLCAFSKITDWHERYEPSEEFVADFILQLSLAALSSLPHCLPRCAE